MTDRMTHAQLRAVAEAATPGPWRAVAQGGSSTVLSGAKPLRNDSRIPTYAYRDEEHCIAYPFIDEEGRQRLDFVCFSHGDALHIATFDPPTVLAFLTELEAARGRVESIADVIHRIAETAEGEGDRMYFASTNDPHTLIRQARYLRALAEPTP